MNSGKKILDVHVEVDEGMVLRYFTMEDGSLIMCMSDLTINDHGDRWIEICDKMPRIIVDGAQ
jgi:hypothetical protein